METQFKSEQRLTLWRPTLI